ncbi:MAG: methyltransferase [Symploca sp. SIO2C1]|nr:methyltransferase [Symploca sp. SIO2C1]
MIYPDFNNIIINNSVGVSPVGSDTQLIAQQVAQLDFTRALEVGIGTGFIPIYLSTLNRQCEGIDINPQAINCASENAKLNQVDVKFFLSDLFANVTGKFELIIFNPPYGNVRSTFASKYLEIIKSLLPKENPLLSKITYLLIRKSRRQLISLFLDNVKSVLVDSGNIVILLHYSELDLIKDSKFRILGELGQQKLVCI